MPVVFGAPGRYVQGPGELGHLGACVARLGVVRLSCLTLGPMGALDRRLMIVFRLAKASRSRCFACTTGRAPSVLAGVWLVLAHNSSAIASWGWAAARCSTSQKL